MSGHGVEITSKTSRERRKMGRSYCVSNVCDKETNVLCVTLLLHPPQGGRKEQQKA